MSDQTQIKPGDVVTLKSGGPGMTVSQVNDAESFECIWFEEGYLHKDYFKTVSLQLKKEIAQEKEPDQINPKDN